MNSYCGPFRDDYSFLSNMHTAIIFVMLADGKREKAPSVEHAYFALRTKKLEDARVLLAQKTPAAAKKLAKTLPLKQYDAPALIAIMRVLIHKKFAIPELRKKLLATENRDIIEVNNWKDTFWGVCPEGGKNWLGRIIMDEREAIANSTRATKVA